MGKWSQHAGEKWPALALRDEGVAVSRSPYRGRSSEKTRWQ